MGLGRPPAMLTFVTAVHTISYT